MIGQAEVKEDLVKRLDIDVRYCAEVSSVKETAKLVEIAVEEQRVTSRYVIAADGGQS